MEEEIRKTSRGAERMAEFEKKLAADVERRARSENKIAKTTSANLNGVKNGEATCVAIIDVPSGITSIKGAATKM